MFAGSSIDPGDLKLFPDKAGARICALEASQFLFTVEFSEITFSYHTDDNNVGDATVRGLEIAYTLKGKLILCLFVCLV